jgi:hypothetical protein
VEIRQSNNSDVENAATGRSSNKLWSLSDPPTIGRSVAIVI